MKKNLYLYIIASILVTMGCSNSQTNNSASEDDTLSVDSTKVDSLEVQDELVESQPKPKIIDINGHEAKLLYSFVTGDGIVRDFYQVEVDGCYQLYCKDDAIKKTRRIETPYDRYDSGDDFYENGFYDPFLYTTSPDGRYLYLVSDIHANSNGWTQEFQLHMIDCERMNDQKIADCAAIKKTDEGFTVAGCRLTNGDTATCVADEVWLMHDAKIDWEGNQLFDDRDNEYDYETMEKKYSNSKRDYWYVRGFDDADDIN